MHSRLSEPIIWSDLDQGVVSSHRERMNYRAKVIANEAQLSTQCIADIHGETVKQFPRLRHLVFSALWFLRLIGFRIGTTAVDIGSGTGTGAAILSLSGHFQKIYAVDYSEAFVEAIMPLVFSELGARHDLIQRVVGNFNYMEFKDEELDLALEITAFHHAEDLSRVVRETYRCLKPGGALIAIDRAWPDELTEAERGALLAREYDAEQKKKIGVPADEVFTRQDWGEHEYRLSEWMKAFKDTGFDAASISMWYPQHRYGSGALRRWPTIVRPSVILSALLYRLGLRSLYWTYFDSRTVFICIRR